MRAFFLCLVVLLPLQSLAGLGGASRLNTPEELRELWKSAGKKKRKQVTSNPFHFWAWSRNYADGFLHAYLGPEGVVIGDPHLRNVFDYRVQGEAMLAVADIDDGGRAPFVLDLVRYITYLEASDDVKTKIRDVFDAYLRGLDGKEDPAPGLLRKARKVTAKKIGEDHEKFIKKHVRPDGFLNLESLELLDPKDLSKEKRDQVEALSLDALQKTHYAKIWGKGYKVYDSGSSAGMSRFWVLVGDENGGKLLLEFKEQQRASTYYYEPQSEASARIRSVAEAYSESGLDPSLFGVVSAGGAAFWMRPRHYQSLDIGDDNSSAKEKAEFALYLANWLGMRHGAQPAGKSLRDLLQRDPDAAKKAVEGMVRAYLSEIADFS